MLLWPVEMGGRWVELFTNKLIYELKEVMIMTGCKSLDDITNDKIVNY